MSNVDMNEIHWMMDMFQTVDVGLVVLNREYRVKIWNGFMENHSGMTPNQARDKEIFDIFPALDEAWFRKKSESVFLLKNRSFTIWEQHSYIFKFRNYRPITGVAEYMYQNSTFIPLTNTRGEVEHICIIIYDVTDQAVAKQELEKMNRRFEQLSNTDMMTSLNNRRSWDAALLKEFKRLQRNNGTSCLLLFDIDFFKKINDGYGHAGGDEAIKALASLLRGSLRASDIAGRYGGEEFGVILVDTDVEGAKIFAERLRQKVAASKVPFHDEMMQFTCSFGIAAFRPDLKDVTDWIECADKALYHSKENGRNQTNIYEG